MTELLHIRLLGTFHVSYGDDAVDSLRRSRVQELIAYLLLHAGTPHSRQHLAFQFWPESTEKQARTNLRNVLHTLRQSLPHAEEYLHITASTVEWKMDSDYTVDVADVLRLLHKAEEDSLNAESLKKAVDLYSGELLPGCYEAWLMAKREQLEQRMVAALEKLVTLLENKRAYTEGIEYAQRLVTLDPLRELSYLKLMRFHALAGNRSASLHVYQECATILREELDVEPGPELTRAYEWLDDMEAQPEHSRKTALQTPDSQELVGRERDWQTLHSIWEQALLGDAEIAVISGEAGFGKTRLAEELFYQAGRLGAITARTRSFASQSDLVYTPVVDLLRQDALNQRLMALDEVWLTEIARLLPELVESGRVTAAPQPLTESWQQQHLLQALVRAVTVDDLPLLLLIDDLQWCDRETLQWLQYLLHDAPTARILVMGTVRAEEVDDRHPYTALKRDLMRAGKFTGIPVALLNRQETVALAEQVAERKLSQKQADTIWEITAGNPLFVVETVRYWMDSSIDETVNILPESASPDATVEHLPPAVYSVIRNRFVQLSIQAQEVVSLAATIGRSFAYSVLKASGDLSEEPLIDSLEELLQRRIVREVGEVYDFSHDRIRDVAYAEVSRTRRRLLHGRVAAAIESVHATDLDEVSGDLAHHHEQAGNLRQAVDYLRRAGERVAAQFANDEAVAYYTRALALIPETEPEKRIDLLLLREAIYTTQQKNDKRQVDVEEMQRLVECVQGDPDAINRYRAEIKLRQVASVGSEGNLKEAIRLAKSAVELAQAAGATDIEAEAYWYWGREQWAIGRLQEATSLLEMASQLAQQTGNNDVEARALEFIATVGIFSGSPTAEILAQLDRCMTIFRKRGDLLGQSRIHHKTGYLILHFREDLGEGKSRMKEALQMAELTGDTERTEIIFCLLAYFLICEGKYEESERRLCEVLRMTQRRGYQYWIAVSLLYIGFALTNRGDFDSAISHFEEADRVHKEVGGEQFFSEGYCHFSLCYHYAGRPLDAEAMAQNALAVTRKLGDKRREGEALVCLGHSLASLERLDEAIEAYTQGLALHRKYARSRHSLEALAGLARVAERTGNTDQAAAYIEEILKDLDSMSSFATEESFRVYHTCYKLLHQRQDTRAADLLRIAYEQLQQRVASISDIEQQEFFWEMPGHREIEHAWRTHTST